MQARRHQYLKAMGIQVWQERSCSSNANLNTRTVELEDTLLAQVDTETASQQSSDPAKGLIPKDVIEAYPSESSKSEKVINQANSPGSPEFRLASIVFPDACLIVSQVPLQVSEPVSTDHLAYLKNLLFAFGITCVGLPQITLFNWPMLRSANFDQSYAAALEASQAFLKAQKIRHSVPLVLLMGEEAGRYLLPEATVFKMDKGRLSQSDEGVILLTESIENVFIDPQLKADVWADLQALRN